MQISDTINKDMVKLFASTAALVAYVVVESREPTLFLWYTNLGRELLGLEGGFLIMVLWRIWL